MLLPAASGKWQQSPLLSTFVRPDGPLSSPPGAVNCNRKPLLVAHKCQAAVLFTGIIQHHTMGAQPALALISLLSALMPICPGFHLIPQAMPAHVSQPCPVPQDRYPYV